MATTASYPRTILTSAKAVDMKQYHGNFSPSPSLNRSQNRLLQVYQRDQPLLRPRPSKITSRVRPFQHDMLPQSRAALPPLVQPQPWQL